VDPRTGLDVVEKRKFLTLPGLELRPLGRPAHIVAIPTALSRLLEIRVMKWKLVKNPYIFRIWGCHPGGYEFFFLVGYNAV
jgi:hypothetical protein